jgi:predicted AAA+ superfamily ATPase
MPDTAALKTRLTGPRFQAYYSGMIARSGHLEVLKQLLKTNPVVGIVGARQVGKTTLARMLCATHGNRMHYFDLEDPDDMARLADPALALKPLRGLVVIDEVQQLPGLFPVLRVLADRPRTPARFLILGSASPQLLERGSETLAGRIAYHGLTGLSLQEVGPSQVRQLWLRGGFPRAFLARDNAESMAWRRNFVRSFLERDLPNLGVRVASAAMRRFWTMLAHYHGQVWNASEFGRSFGVADTTVRHYLDIMTSALILRQLQPWHANISKRQVKAPKVYIADSGLLHTLLRQSDMKDLQAHPRVGASWEGFVIEQVIARVRAEPEECFFWATHAGAELDLMVVRGRRRIGFEAKLTGAPAVTRSMIIAMRDLSLERLDVIHAGDHTFPLADKIRAVPLSRILTDIAPLR